MNRKTTIRRIDCSPVRDDSGTVTRHRLSIPFLGTFTVYPARVRAAGSLDLLLFGLVGTAHTVASLNRYLSIPSQP